MSEQKKFNIGDRVRVKDPEWELRFDCGNDIGVITSEDIGKVKRESFYGEDFVEVAFCDGWVCDDLLKEELEVVESYDRKTDFLTRLSKLLREFDAEIEYHIGSDEKSDYSEYYAITIGRERLTFDNCEGASLTADNLMDYDKE